MPTTDTSPAFEYRRDRNDHAPVAQLVEQRIYIPSAPDKRQVPVRARPGAPSFRIAAADALKPALLASGLLNRVGEKPHE